MAIYTFVKSMAAIVAALTIIAVDADNQTGAIDISIASASRLWSSGSVSQVINCTVDPTKAGLETVAGITLKASDPCGVQGVFYEVASADIWSDQPVLTMESDGNAVNVSGSVSKEPGHVSYLTISWHSASAHNGRSFKCWVNGITDNGAPMTLSKTVTEQVDEHLKIKPDDSEDTALIKTIARQVETLSEIQTHVVDNTASTETTLDWYIGLVSQYQFSPIYHGKIYLATKVSAAFDIDLADKACVSAGGYLVELDDEAEYDFVNYFTQQLEGNIHYLIGANDIEVEGRYVHKHSGKPLVIDKWASGEPSDPRSSSKEDCVMINYNGKGLYDLSCTYNARYVCEVPFPPSV